MTTYVALLRKDARSDFGVEFPDFPGCVTAGRTLEEARLLARDALALHVEGMIEDGDEIPAPTSTDGIMEDATNRSAIAFLVEVDTEPKSVRVNVTFAPDVLRRIDLAAQRAKLSRSAFLAAAALARCDEGKGVESRAARGTTRHSRAAARSAAGQSKTPIQKSTAGIRKTTKRNARRGVR